MKSIYLLFLSDEQLLGFFRKKMQLKLPTKYNSMASENEYGTKSRLLRILLTILESPGTYNSTKLANIYDCVPSTIRRDIETIKNAGFIIESNKNNCFSFVENKPYLKLKDLLHFSEEEQQLLHQSIDQINISEKRGKRLKTKLASLYNFQRLGHSYLRKPYLNKVDKLQLSFDEKKQVILKDYRSATRIADRLVEAIHISPPDDTLQAFEIESKKCKHYRISRIRNVEIQTAQNWAYESHHNILRTDPFRIVDNKQVMVHMRIGVGAYNELRERFPMTRNCIEETEVPEIYDFQGMINHKFIGLTNFILGFHHQHIEVLEPDSLIIHLRKQIEKMKF